ncbi:MAG TPA: DUF2332 domain-containing protein [Jatrophihabitans sp.]|uniref:DUF2332 domain-containing protein n=1 Tax=Jatrophihabitans sp. TaxID=1932789 RepID=UPI002E09A1A0|nr:DUF2332 domain-containing protein [Jatrophihabitans sp.]
MPDWTGAEDDSTATRYRLFGESQVHGISPRYEAICLGIADDAEMLRRLDALPRPKRQPNLLLGAVRFLGGPVESWPAFRAFALDRWDDVTATMAVKRTQTNEPRRCATLLPVLAGLPGPLALLEVGASAGLCLYPDRYGYRYESDIGTHALGDGPRLDCRTTGAVPLPAAVPTVAWRAGLDLNPLDVRDDEDVRWLEALIWPEQTDRFGLLRDAVTIARRDPPRIVAGDLLTDLTPLAAEAPPGATLVVFHSAVLAYVDRDGRLAFADLVRRLAEQRPTVWVSNEAPGVVAGTERPGEHRRFVLARDGLPVALTGPHGHTIDWLAG